MNVKYIQLSKGQKVAVDEDDYEFLTKRNWYARKSGRTYLAQSDSFPRVYMHRLIMNALKGFEVDHIDGNGLNNCKHNLRICTHAQNSQSQTKQLGTYSIYKGVSLDPRSSKWYAYIKTKGKRIYLGSFTEEINAAIAYNTAAKEVFGEFAKLNQV